MKEKSYSQGLGRHTHEDRKWSKRLLMAVTAMLLLSNQLFAQSNASKQPLPTFKYRADNTADTARQYKVVPGKETKAVSVCAVWNLTDTAERTLWSMADSNGKVAAKAGGKALIKKDVIVSIICLLLQIEINKYRCGLAVLTTSAASCDETVK